MSHMKPKLFFSTKALIVKDGMFLALKRSDSDSQYLDLPGGRMEYGEKLTDTLIREVFEETGLKITPKNIIDSWDLIEANRQISGVIFQCSMASGEISLSPEHSDFEWLGGDSIQKLYPVFSCKGVSLIKGLKVND